jgi:hypothetical protein
MFCSDEGAYHVLSPGLASNRSTVKPLSPPPRHTCMVQAEHPSPSARQFRLLPNGLRRMFLQLRSCPALQWKSLLDAPVFGSQDAIAQRSLPVLPVRPVQPAPTHPSPSAREFRLLLNGLAAAELRRMFCSDEGACVRFGCARGWR